MPSLFCDGCKVKLPYGRFSPPSGVFLICRDCSLFLNCKRRAVDEQRSNNVVVSNSRATDDTYRHSENVENQSPAVFTSEASQTETICRLRNQQSLVASGLAESYGDDDALNLVNQNLLPALSISSQCSAVFLHRLGKPRQDGSPRLCKLYFNSTSAADAVLSRTRNLRSKLHSVLAGVHFRPSLTRSQIERKQILEDFRWNTFSKDATGRLPVVIHYEPDGSPFLWDFGNKCRVHLPIPTQSVSVSLEPVPVAVKVSISSGPEEVSCTELGVQTDTLFIPNDLSASQSDVSERGSWTDNDADDDQWVDYDSDNYADKEKREKEEENAFQRQLQAIKSKARPFTEDENQIMEDRVKMALKQFRDSNEPSSCPVPVTTADCAGPQTCLISSTCVPAKRCGPLCSSVTCNGYFSIPEGAMKSEDLFVCLRSQYHIESDWVS